jgi:hypothetical protein
MKSTLLKAASLAAVLLASASFAAGPRPVAKAEAYVPDTMATEFLWTPVGVGTIADEVDTMATEFVWTRAEVYAIADEVDTMATEFLWTPAGVSAVAREPATELTQSERR